MEKLLIVEDDREIRNLIRDYAVASGYAVAEADRGSKALLLFEQEHPDIVLLDIILPEMDGFELCRRIRRESDVPIIMVSSKQEDTDKILALGLGADDYVEKPFSPRLLMAKIKSSLRRYHELSGRSSEEVIEISGISISPVSRTVKKGDTHVSLSAKEFDLLFYLMSHRNKVFSREKIFEDVWGYDSHADISTVTVHVKKIREKIEDNPAKPQILETVWGVGYVIR